MQTNHCCAKSTSRGGNLEQYRRLLAQAKEPMEQATCLPPRRRRAQRCPLGLRPCDLINLTMAATTVLAAGVLLMGM